MKKADVKVGGLYRAKVNDRLTTVRVDSLSNSGGYNVTNLTTGKRIFFRSAMRFREEAKQCLKGGVVVGLEEQTKANLARADSHKYSKPVEEVAVEQPPFEQTLGGSQLQSPTAASAATATTPAPANSQPDTSPTCSPDAAAAKPASPPASPSGKAAEHECCSLPTKRTYIGGRPATRCSKCGTHWYTDIAVKDGDTLLKTPRPGLAAMLKGSIQQATNGKHPPHVIVEARAGTGKTTTLVEGLKKVKGLPVSITPSPQQAAVWEAMEQSKDAKSIAFVAFNKSIATELQRRVPQGCDASTMHSMGFKAVQRAFGRCQVESYRVSNIISELLERDIRELRKYEPDLVKATEQLVGLCKMNLLGGNPEELDELARYYDVEMNGSRAKVFDLVPRVLERCKDVAKDGCVDFDDMIWAPVALDLPVFKYDLLLVDEAQDLNRCQQALAKKAGKRLIFVGDPKQAIYGFAGADAKSMHRLHEELSQQPTGCIKLPLTVTRRCGKAIVAEAQRFVPDFEAHESNGAGKISQAQYPKEGQTAPDYTGSVLDGDMILCRVNAPLVSQCFRFLKVGLKANIQGRDIGQGLISTVKKLKAQSIPDLTGKVDDWLYKEQSKERAKRNPNDARLIALQDRADCLHCFTKGCETVDDVIRKIESVFTDNKDITGIRLSSCHKAKGLEAKRVFFINTKDAPCPHPMAKQAWEREQEHNILYVGITRAIEELIWVS
jgi:hypothetical protein